MDERSVAAAAQEHLAPPAAVRSDQAAATTATEPAGGELDDPRLLQILSTEHWSLLSQRSLVYNEAFARAGMFLTFLSASLVALGFLASAMSFSAGFLVIAALLLTLDLVIGLATLGRVLDATIDDLRAIQGMNRIRHAYVEIVPQAQRYFISSIHDDARGVLATYGEPPQRHWLVSFIHGMTTASSMVGTIVSVLGAVVVAVLVLLAHGDAAVAVGGGVVGFLAIFLGQSRYESFTIRRFEDEMAAMFPTPDDEVELAPGKR